MKLAHSGSSACNSASNHGFRFRSVHLRGRECVISANIQNERKAGASLDETPARTFRCPVCVAAVREAAAFKLYRKSLKAVASPHFRGAAPDPARKTLRGTRNGYLRDRKTRGQSRGDRNNGQI
jgi:hypothetical protein